MDKYFVRFKPNRSDDSPGIRWCLDKPADASVFTAEQLLTGIMFSGWLIVEGNNTPVIVVVQSSREQCFDVNKARPDVVTHMALRKADAATLSCGFSGKLSFEQDSAEIWLELNTERYCLGQLHVVSHTPVIRGKEGWLFLDNDSNKSVEQFSGKRLLGWTERRRWRRYFARFSDVANRFAMPHALLMAPSKESVYSQYYPYVRGKKTIIDQLLQIKPAALNLCYPVLALQNHSHRTYKFTDTHWSTHGARIATECLALQLGLDGVLVERAFARDYYYNAPLAGDLGSKVFPPVTAKEVFIDNYHYLKKRVYDNGLPNFGRIQVFVNDNAVFLQHCLVFGSSSSYAMLSYLTRVFSRLTLVHSAGNIDENLVAQLQPGYLVAQTNERFAVRAPEVGYSVRDSIKQKVATLPATTLAKTLAEIQSKYDVVTDQQISLLHQFLLSVKDAAK